MNLVDILQHRAEERPDATAYVFRTAAVPTVATRTYRQLHTRARAVGAALQHAGLTGKPVPLSFPPGLDFVEAFLGCLYAGALPIPCAEPRRGGRARGADRMDSIVADTGAAVVLTNEAKRSLGREQSSTRPELESVSWVACDTIPDDGADRWVPPSVDDEDLALLQYTSGTTSTPRGVMVSHGNLIANLSAIQERFGHDADSVGVIWLPHYHDMGLIGGILQPLFSGFPVTLIPPQDVLRRPLGWLEAVSELGATVSGGPNFAYDLCVQRLGPGEASALDLSRWSVAFTGAEPVRAETLDRFAEAFAPSGFERRALYPVYGLAEATLMVTGGQLGQPPVVEEAGGSKLVGCGSPIPGHSLCIVDPVTRREVAPGNEGEIWVSGPSVARGYWGRDEETRRVFENQLPESQAAFLATGDLGFIRDGHLFVTGRSKDLIIVRGENHYPQDIEHTVEQVAPEIAKAGVVAFALHVGSTEGFGLVCEVNRSSRHKMDAPEVLRRIRRELSEDHGLVPEIVVLVRPGAVPRTTSGKIRRGACREVYLQGGFDPIGVSKRPQRGTPVPSPQALAPAIDPTVLRSLSAEDSRARIEVFLRGRLRSILPQGTPAVSPEDTWSEVGLDSVHMAELMAYAQAALAVEMSSEVLDKVGTLRGLSRALSDALRAPSPVRARRGVPPELPPTPAQSDFLSPQYERQAGLVAEVLVRVPPGLSAQALEEAVRTVSERHHALGVRFVAGPNGWRQVLGGRGVDWQHVSAHSMDKPALRALSQRLTEEAISAFDLARSPLMRATFVDRGGDATGLLRVDVSHLAADRVSLMVLFAELEAQLRRGDVETPSVYGRSYMDWIGTLVETASSPEVEAEASFWTSMCESVADVGVGGTGPYTLAPAGLDAARTVLLVERYPTPRAQRTLFLAALVSAWAEASGQEDVLVELEDDGRQSTGNAVAPMATVGWLTDRYPVRVRPTIRGTLEEEVEDAAVGLDGLPRQGKGYGLLAHLSPDLRLRRRMAALPKPMLALTFSPREGEWFRPEAALPVLSTRVLFGHGWTDARRGWGLRLAAGTRGERFVWSVQYDPVRVGEGLAATVSAAISRFLSREGAG